MAKRCIFPLGCGVSAMTGGTFKSFYAEFAVTPCNESSQEPKKQRFPQEVQGRRNFFLLHVNEILPEMSKYWNIFFIFVAQSLFYLQCGSKSL